jgi:hypothetical protein
MMMDGNEISNLEANHVASGRGMRKEERARGERKIDVIKEKNEK